jgi:thioredoxin 1
MKELVIVFLLALALGSAINSYKWDPAPAAEPTTHTDSNGSAAGADPGGPAPLPGPSPEASNITTGGGASGGMSGGNNRAATSTVVGVTTDATFENQVLKSQIPVLVDFYAPWCEPCRMMAPVIDEIANENNGRLKVYKLDCDDNQRIAGTYTDGAIPTFCIFKNGHVVEKFVGARPKATLVEAVNKICGSTRNDAFASAPQPGNTALPPPTLTNAATAKNEDIPLIDELGFDRDVIKSASPVLVFFCDGSEACSKVWPTVESVASKVFDKYRVVRVDVTAHPTIAQDYYVAATPAFAIFKDGKRYKQLAGVVPEQYLMTFLELQHTASAANPSGVSTYN